MPGDKINAIYRVCAFFFSSPLFSSLPQDVMIPVKLHLDFLERRLSKPGTQKVISEENNDAHYDLWWIAQAVNGFDGYD